MNPDFSSGNNQNTDLSQYFQNPGEPMGDQAIFLQEMNEINSQLKLYNINDIGNLLTSTPISVQSTISA